jgi:GNAT superfamily N-acetyltransferase
MSELSELPLPDRVELGEAAAWADACAAPPPDWAERYGLDVQRIGPAVVSTVPGVDFPLFNRAVGLGVATPATEVMIDAILAFYRDHGVRNFLLQISPAARPAELPRWLTDRGLCARASWAKLHRGVEPPPAVDSDLRVEPVAPGAAAVFARTVAEGYSLPAFLAPWMEGLCSRPAWRCYLAYDGDRPVATGALFVHGRTGWLGMETVLPSHRGRNGQAALIAQRIRDAAQLGCTALLAETAEDTAELPNASYRNLARAGFSLIHLRANYGLL